MSKPIVVVGDGWAALGATGYLVASGKKVVWISGTGSHIASPLPSLETGFGLQGAEVFKKIAGLFQIDCGDFQSGSFLREFRNKAFREPSWVKAPTVEDRSSVMEECVWAPELSLVPVFEGRFSHTFQELEEMLRGALAAGDAGLLRRIDEVPVSAVRSEGGKIIAISLSSGEEIQTDEIIYADRWEALPKIQGLPKVLPFARKKDPISILQVVFTHETPVGQGLQEGFFGALHKEAGEEQEKHLWGYFSSDGRKSCWTLCLTGEEVEDNHAITKKLRRLKNALDRIFVGESWVPTGKKTFMENVLSEQVLFEEGVLYPDSSRIMSPASLAGLQGLSFLTDGYGPSCAFHQIGDRMGLLDSLSANTETESVNAEPSTTL